MSVIGLIGAGIGLATTLYGAHASSKAAKEQEKQLAKQKAVNQAWYDRNYYQDYLNSVQAQNALKKYREAWEDRVKEERARQVISGGTPEQAQAVAEAGGEAMSELMGNLAAQGEQRKENLDAMKMQMDNNLSQQEAQIAANRQQAAANLMSGGAGLMTSSLQAMDTKAGASKAPKVETPTAEVPATVVPESSSTRVNAPDVVGKEAGINPGLVVPENEYYSKNKKYY